MPRLALLVLALEALGCQRAATCSSELTDGTAIYRAPITGRRPRADLTREATRRACDQLCAAADPVKSAGCGARCAVDTEVGKLGVRIACTEGDGR